MQKSERKEVGGGGRVGITVLVFEIRSIEDHAFLEASGFCHSKNKNKRYEF